MTTLNRVAPLIQRQLGLITLAQLYAAGLSRGQVRTLVAHGRLRRIFDGVYAVEGAPATARQRALAAVLACADGAALSHLSAACHWRLLEHWPAEPHVTVPGRSGARGPRGIRLHHSLNLDSVVFDRIRVTTLARTLQDIAGHPSLKAAIRQAERLHRLDLTAIEATGRLRRFLEAYVSAAGTANDFEAEFLALCDRHGIARPLTGQRVGRYWPDFLWPDECLIAETDGRGSHDTFVSFREDRVRLRHLQGLGYEVLPFTYEEVHRRPGRVARELTAALGRRRRPRWSAGRPA